MQAGRETHMATAKFSEEVFAAITKGITEKVLSEIDNLRERIEEASQQAKRDAGSRTPDRLPDTLAALVADVAAMRRTVHGLDIRMTAIELQNRADRRGRGGVDPEARPIEDATEPVVSKGATREALGSPDATRANSLRHPASALRRMAEKGGDGNVITPSAAAAPKHRLEIYTLKYIEEKFRTNGAPQSLIASVMRAVERLPAGFDGVGPSVRSLMGTPSFISITTMMARFYMSGKSERMDIEDFLHHVKTQKNAPGIGTVWSMLSALTALGIVSASDKNYVSKKHGGPWITGHFIMDQRFLEDAISLSKNAA